MPTLKSVASVTTGEPDTFFSVIACSSVMASSLWRITSKVIGSIAAVPRDWPFCRDVVIARSSAEIDGKVAGVIEPRGLAEPDIDGGFRMLDDRGAGHAKSRRHVEPLKDRRFGPGECRRLENAPACGFRRGDG